MGTIVFFYFASVIVVTAALVVALRNPVYNALALLVMFFHVAGLFVTLHAEFLAVIQILVYAGAILVLYLFVVMLLNLKREERFIPPFRGSFCPTTPPLPISPTHIQQGSEMLGNILGRGTGEALRAA